MNNSFGNNIILTVFGASHGECVGCTLRGLPKGLPVDESVINHYLALRRPEGDISTSRREPDAFVIESGVNGGFTDGGEIRITIPNIDARPTDYAKTKGLARPSHADYTRFVKYGGLSSGGGLFSGRSTAALCAAGALLTPYLNSKGVFIGTHIKNIAGVCDRDFGDHKKDINALYRKKFAVLDKAAGQEMKNRILAAKAEGDSVGGILETAVIGLTPGLGEPYFDSLESLLSHALFSIPGVKGVEFGAGFRFAGMRGGEANDPFACENGRVITLTNNSGGINGGISNGMPVVFRCALRPTPTIAKPQKTVDLETKENAVTEAAGRHDPCFVHRARAVVDCLTAFVLADLYLGG